MLQVVNGQIMNSRDVGNAVAKLLLGGMAMDQISALPGMPTPVQIAYLRRSDPQFADAFTTALEGAGIEAAFALMGGFREGSRMNKNQIQAAMWVAERTAPELFQERKTITSQETILSDEELAFQIQAAARSDERVLKMVQNMGIEIDGETVQNGKAGPVKARATMKMLRRYTKRKDTKHRDMKPRDTKDQNDGVQPDF